MKDLSWLIPLFPLIGFLIIGLGNKKLSKMLVSLIGCGSIGLSFLIVLTLLFPALDGSLKSETIHLFNWINAGSVRLPMEFLIDPLSILMMCIITGIGLLIHIYSAGYMWHDEGFARYFSYLNLFVFFMLLLVMGNNYVVLFAGWEGVGLCSYLLIGFWFKNHEYNNAAKKAFIMNRIGDLGFLLGMLLIFVTFGSLSYDIVLDPEKWIINPEVAAPVLIVITLLLFIGATGKSAQIPLYTWLPDAMAGPTPVSALIHAATMVTAGIYMIVRSNVLFTLSHFSMEVIEVVGLATAIFAATIGLVQNDIKKVLAYSTVSQLGYMFFALGLGAYSTAMFHLTTHAFFKALLFLCAGSVIHAMSGEQDIRNMGGLKKALPLTFWTFLAGTLAISGIFPFAGFFSKDEILSHAFEHAPFLWGIALFGALLTTFYMFRLLYLTFYGTFRGTAEQKAHLHESPAVMTIPLILLAILSTLGGLMGIPEVLGGNNAFKRFLSPVIDTGILREQPDLAQTVHLHTMELVLMGISTAAVISIIIITWIYYRRKNTMPLPEGAPLPASQKLLQNKYYVDEIYEAIVVKPFYWLSDKFYALLEIRVIDGFVNAWGKALERSGAGLRHLQSGNIGFYLFAMVIGIILILFFNTIIKL